MSGHAVMVEAHHQRRHGMQRARPKSAKPSEGVMDDWTPEAVRDWLTEVGYPTVGEAALRAGVSGCALPFLGHEGFRELGLESTVERVKVLGLLSKLTSQSGTAETKKESCWQELRRPLPQISADCCRSKPRSAWSRLKQVATKIDSVAWADHKKPWFEHLAMSGRSPDAVREAFMAQLDSYNLLTLLLLATVLPTSVSIGVELKWDADGMPTSRFKLACLVYSVMYSIVIFFHFSLNHITSVLVTDVSTANFQLFLDAFGKDLMADVGIYFLVVYYNFFAWVLLSMAAVIAESAHWTVHRAPELHSRSKEASSRRDLPFLAQRLSFVPPPMRAQVAKECMDPQFIAALRQAFHIAEDAGAEQEPLARGTLSWDELVVLWRIVKGVFLLADAKATQRYLRQDLYEDVMGMLEYDEGIPKEKRICHRQMLKVAVRFKEVLTFQDAEMLELIHLNYRVQYLKDAVLPRVLDDAAFASFRHVPAVHPFAAALLAYRWLSGFACEHMEPEGSMAELPRDQKVSEQAWTEPVVELPHAVPDVREENDLIDISAKAPDIYEADEELLPVLPQSKEDTDVVKERPPTASLCKLYSMMDAVDALVLFLGFVGATGNGLAQPLMCIVFGDLIDGMGGNAVDMSPEMMEAGMAAMMDQMEELCVTMLLLGLGSFVGASLQGSCFKIFAERQALKYRTLYFDAVLHQDVGWFDTKDISALPSEINDDLHKIQDAFGDKCGNGVMSAAAFLGGFGCAFGMGWLIALVMCAMLPFMGVGAAVMGKAIQEIMLESQSWYAKASGIVEECLYAMRTVVAFGGEHRELKKFAEALVNTRRGGTKNGFKVGAGMGYTMCVVFLGYALAFWFGMTLRYHDQINPSTGKLWEPGTIMSIFFCIFIGSFSIGSLDPSLKAMRAAQAAAGRFYSILNNKSVIQCRLEDSRASIDSIENFEFNDVHFTYPARPDVKVINGLSLTIQRGQKVAFVGESGSGKSTVMALLERFYDPDAGFVSINGKDMRSFKVGALRRCIGYVGQEPVLFASSIRNNIMQGNPEASKEEFTKACMDAQLDYVENLPDQYNTFVGSGGGQLSGGQKQRIAIARALLKKASFLFLDEATSALDNASEKMIQATIDNISSNMTDGLGIVSIAHRLSTVRNADVIYVLSRGSLVERGTHTSLMEKKGTYYALVAAQESSDQADEEENNQNEAAAEEKATRRQSTVSEESETARAAKEKKAEEEREKDIVTNYKVPMARLLSYNKPEWPFFVPAVLGALAEGAAMPVCTIALVGSMEAFFITDKEVMRAELELMAIIFVIIGVSNLIAAILSNGCFAILNEAMTQRLRIAILTSMFRQEVGFHDDPVHTPGMLSKALELWAFRVTVLCNSVASKASAMSSLLVGLVIAFVYCWQMSLVMLGSIPIMVIANALQMIVLLGASKKENANLTNAQQIVVDSVMNARTVQALGVEKSLVTLYMGWVNKSSEGLWRRNFLAGLGFGVASGILFPVMAGGFYVASILIRDGAADFRGVMMAFMGVFYAGAGAGQAAVMAGDATKAKVACHDMFKLMDRVSQIDGLEPTGEDPKGLEAGHIQFQDVKFFYPFRPEMQVLKGISFTISAGMSVGLVGPSGGGKSTVMSLIQRFYDPQEGSVLIGKEMVALNTVNIRWWRRQIGFVGQEPVLFNTTVRSNIMYGLSDDESVSEEYIRKCEGMCNLGFLYKNGNKGLETEVGPRGGRLSGGQKQRVAICRALIRNPPVMLLDEATSALDTQSEAIVQKALEAAREGRTSFAIAHRLSTVQGCDIILVNADGRVVESGNHAQLMQQKGVYYKLQMQAQK
eukprot:s2066_g2.t3